MSSNVRNLKLKLLRALLLIKPMYTASRFEYPITDFVFSNRFYLNEGVFKFCFEPKKRFNKNKPCSESCDSANCRTSIAQQWKLKNFPALQQKKLNQTTAKNSTTLDSG